jgi:hypothetical protein
MHFPSFAPAKNEEEKEVETDPAAATHDDDDLSLSLSLERERDFSRGLRLIRASEREKCKKIL